MTGHRHWRMGASRPRRRAARRIPAAGALLCIGMATVPLAAQTDIAGAEDPAGIDRFPRSWIVEYELRADALPYDFVTAPVDKIRREARIQAVRVNGPLRRVTYRMPDDANLADVIDHYRSQVDAVSPGAVFTCEGPDCGRSTIWANDVFGVAKLSAPNRSQFYLGAPVTIGGASQLVAIYAVQRGNRRVYAHVDVVLPDRPVAFDANRSLAQTLLRDGFAAVEGVAPDAGGALDEDELTLMAAVAESLASLRGETLHVVCHLYGALPVAELTAAAGRCAESVAGIFEAKGVAASAHGIGPLAPGGAGAKPRIELVLPHRLRSD